jgi:hypothetical protein
MITLNLVDFIFIILVSKTFPGNKVLIQVKQINFFQAPETLQLEITTYSKRTKWFPGLSSSVNLPNISEHFTST